MPEWTFDPTITLSDLIAAGSIILALFYWGMRMQINMRVMNARMDRIDTDIADLKTHLEDIANKI